jgi:hypothetical protein
VAYNTQILLKKSFYEQNIDFYASCILENCTKNNVRTACRGGVVWTVSAWTHLSLTSVYRQGQDCSIHQEMLQASHCLRDNG